MNVGYIGLGAMGRALAARLVDYCSLKVWDLNPAAVAEFTGRGGAAARSIDDIGRTCDVVLLCLPRSADVKAVLFGDAGLAGSAAPGAIIIDQTSGVPGETNGFARLLAKQGVVMLDAPVAGGVPAALAGAVTIMSSGPRAAYAKVEHILRAISPKLYHVSGEVGDAQALKLVNNIINAACRMATLEITAVARRAGLSLEAISTALNAGAGRSFITEKLLPAMVEQRSSTDFALALMVKDLNQAMALGAEQGAPMPISGVARAYVQTALNIMGAEAHLDDVVPFMEKTTGVHFADPPASPAADAASVLALADNTLAACNALVVYETVAMAVKFGLEAGSIAPVINNGSAYSAQATRIFEQLQGEAPASGISLGWVVETLTAFASLAASCGAPALIVNEVRALYLGRLNQVGADMPIEAMASHYEANAGIAFARGRRRAGFEASPLDVIGPLY